MVPTKSLYFVAGSKLLEQEKNTKIFMASFLSSNGCISAHFDNIYLKVLMQAYSDVC